MSEYGSLRGHWNVAIKQKGLLPIRWVWSTQTGHEWVKSPVTPKWSLDGAGRFAHSMVTEGDARVWLFGGFAPHAGGSYVMLNDLWHSNDLDNHWVQAVPAKGASSRSAIGASLFFTSVQSAKMEVYGEATRRQRSMA